MDVLIKIPNKQTNVSANDQSDRTTLNLQSNHSSSLETMLENV